MTASPAAALTTRAQEVSSEIVTDILTLVRHETSSYDLPALAAGLDLLRELAVHRLGRPDHEQRHPGGECGDTLTLTYTGTGPGHVALVGHYDTVWPTGTLAGWEQPSVESGGRAKLSGPGIFDMKTGLAQGIWALKLARESGAPLPTVTFLFNGDEETGSLSSRPVIEAVAQKADVTLVLEPTAHGAVKTARKGSGIFKVTATGVEAHAGLAPQDGASAITALSEFVLAAAAVAAPGRGTTINTGLISGGSATNVVAGQATASIDIRVSSEAEQDRVDAEFDAIKVSDPRVRIDIDHAWNRPPMTLNAASAPSSTSPATSPAHRAATTCPTPPSAAPATPTSSPPSACRSCAAWARSATAPTPRANSSTPTPSPPRPPWSRACWDDWRIHCTAEQRPLHAGRRRHRHRSG